MACRSGCPTQDHGSWGACAKAARFQIGDLKGHDNNKAMEKSLTNYETARRSGIQPRSTKPWDVDRAVAAADTLGRAPELWEK